MLLSTGFHDRTNPDRFVEDVAKLGEFCGNRCMSFQKTRAPGFDARRYTDLLSLRRCLTFDLYFAESLTSDILMFG